MEIDAIKIVNIKFPMQNHKQHRMKNQTTTTTKCLYYLYALPLLSSLFGSLSPFFFFLFIIKVLEMHTARARLFFSLDGPLYILWPCSFFLSFVCSFSHLLWVFFSFNDVVVFVLLFTTHCCALSCCQYLVERNKKQPQNIHIYTHKTHCK